MVVLSTVFLYNGYDVVFENKFNLQQSKRQKSNFNSQLNDSDPIRINGNTQLRDQANEKGWLGNGTKSDPYSIDGLKIIGSGSNILISISNTELYFRISNCILIGGSRGIFLSNVTNSYIISNIIYNNSNYGIYLSSSGSTTIINNTITSNGHGIGLSSANSNTIVNNTIVNNNRGVYLFSSNFSNVVDNIITYVFQHNCLVQKYL